jgi:DNA repair protein RecO (recombination protein O)
MASVTRIEAEPAFVLHERPYRETSALLEVLTRDHGRIGVVARGLRASKPRVQRGTLRPFQCVALGLRLSGEMAQLLSAETLGHPLHLQGDALRAGLYVNELLARMIERHDPHPEVFQRYAHLLTELQDAAALAWNLRRFERDILAMLGFGLQLTHEANTGAELDPDIEYEYRPEQGPCRSNALRSGARCRGSALIALELDRAPAGADIGALRLLMRGIIQHHLGGRELDAWRVLAAPSAS